MQSEALHLYGGDLRADKAILQLEGPEARAGNIQARVRAMRHNFEKVFIKGSKLLQRPRVRRPAGSHPASLPSTSRTSPANSGALSFAALDEALDAVDAVGGQKYLVLEAERRALTAGSRNGGINGGIHITTDELGRQRTMYADTPILIMDRDERNQEILGATEANSTSSIYIASFGDTALTGIQNGGIEVRPRRGHRQAPDGDPHRVVLRTGPDERPPVARLAKIDPTLAAIA